MHGKFAIMKRFLHIICLMGVIVAFSACKIELHSNMEESEANSMMAALISRGIATTKTAGKEGYSLEVASGQFSDAVNILESLGLPAQKFRSVGNVFDDSGLVASPLQERARLNYAKSQELSQSISVIQGVTKVSVQIADTEAKRKEGEVSSIRASVVVQMQESLIFDGIIPQVKQIVSFSVPDIQYENIGVVVTPVREQSSTTKLEMVAGILVAEDSTFLIQIVLVALFLTSILSLVFGGKFAFDTFILKRPIFGDDRS